MRNVINAPVSAKYIVVGHSVRPYNSVTGRPVRVDHVDVYGDIIQITTRDGNVQQFRNDDRVYRVVPA